MESRTVNNLNKAALIGTKSQMAQDESLGAAIPIEIEATWEKGVVTAPNLGMVAHAPPQVAVEPKVPSVLSYCPLMVAGSYSQVFMMQAAEKDFDFESFNTLSSATMDMTSFFRPDYGQNPWSVGVTMQVKIKGSQSQKDIDDLAQKARQRCPAVEVLEKNFPVLVNVSGKEVDIEDDEQYYNIQKYNALASSEQPVIVEQSSSGQWYCRNECMEHPGALMQIFDTIENIGIPVSQEPPIGPGRYPSPIQAWFFGALAFQMHTIAIRLAVRNHLIQSFTCTLKTTINKRKGMGVDEIDAKAFPSRGLIELSIESNAPLAEVRQAVQESTRMSPSFLGMAGEIPTNVNVVMETTEKGRSFDTVAARFLSPSTVPKHTAPTRSSRPAGLSHRNASTRSSISGVSASTERPSLLAGLNVSPRKEKHLAVPSRPRRLWKVSDTSLRHIPPFYPPLDARCTAYVSDAPPSVIAVRIAECLRRRSVSVEYDEEAVTATAMTVDRCHFSVYLWRGSKPSTNSIISSVDDVGRPDFSRGVVVECVRIRGNVISFHQTVQAILQAALSQDTGRDRRKPYKTSPLEYPRLKADPDNDKVLRPPTKQADVHSSSALEGLEHARSLLRKDRLGPQSLGMEALVALTDAETSGIDTAMYTALAITGAPITAGMDEDVACLSEIHEKWILGLLITRRLPSEPEPDVTTVTANSFSFACTTVCDDGEDRLEEVVATSRMRAAAGDEHHGGSMRAMALRAFSNALMLMAEKQPKILHSVLTVQAPQLISQRLLDALMEDVKGAGRPPAVVAGTRLASQHESALAIRCLRILVGHSVEAKRRLKTDDSIETLEKAQHVGKSTHKILEDEATKCLAILTEDARSL